MTPLERLQDDVVACQRCPRLVRHCRKSAAAPPKRFRGQEYWARPCPGFGDPQARLLIVGLAPAAHGANRTGRMFTGDESGKWLYRALFDAGFASAPESRHRDDGLTLRGAWLTNVNRCAPPDNKPTTAETKRCRPFLARELELLADVRVVVALGKIGWDGFLATREALGHPKPKGVKFGHGARVELAGDLTLLGSYHPSQQNTFTGRLTRPMLDSVFATARDVIEGRA